MREELEYRSPDETDVLSKFNYVSMKAELFRNRAEASSIRQPQVIKTSLNFWAPLEFFCLTHFSMA
jgi:hypothetical protein